MEVDYEVSKMTSLSVLCLDCGYPLSIFVPPNIIRIIFSRISNYPNYFEEDLVRFLMKKLNRTVFNDESWGIPARIFLEEEDVADFHFEHVVRKIRSDEGWNGKLLQHPTTLDHCCDVNQSFCMEVNYDVSKITSSFAPNIHQNFLILNSSDTI